MGSHKKVVNINKFHEDLKKIADQAGQTYFHASCEIRSSLSSGTQVVFSGYIAGHGHSDRFEDPKDVLLFFDKQVNPEKYEELSDEEIEAEVEIDNN